MTRSPTRVDLQRRSASRRPGIILGRRFALLAAVAAVALGSSAGVAAADRPAVSATIHEAGGIVKTEGVTVEGLTANKCVNYSGAVPALYGPNGQAQSQPPGVSGTWSLATVLQCGLSPGVAPAAVQSLTVTKSSGGVEQPLTPTDLTPAGDFADMALPLITYDGSNVIYYRPWRGGADQNAGDKVEEGGQAPIAIDVYEGPPLTVVAQPGSETVTAGSTVDFSATVHDANDGGSPAPSTLSYSWDFDGGATSPTSTSTTPVETFPAAGIYNVTLSVTDTAGGGGAATALITVNAAAGTPPPTTPAANAAPTGPSQSNGITPAGSAGKKNPSPSTPKGKQRSATAPDGSKSATARRPHATVHPASTVTPVASRRATARSNQASKSAPAATAPVNGPPKHAATGSTAGIVIDGRLISNVAPLPLDASPLVRIVAASPATAPPVRRPADRSIVPGVAAALAILVLLGLGAGHQLRWLRPRRARVAIG